MAENEITISRNPDSTEKSSRVFTKEYWLEEFERLSQIVHKNGMTLIGCMVEMDTYYDTRIGSNELWNVSAGRASLEKTYKATDLLKEYLKKHLLYEELIAA